jgi:prepilin-type N-terminal cleavage/methylation domain-containing protein
MIYFQKKEQGFSLVETLVAISILLLVVTGPMTISMRTAKSTNFASEQVQAFFLAQEGLELAQKGRDDLLLEYFANPSAVTDPWNSFTDSTSSGEYRLCFSAAGCGLQWNPSVQERLSPARDCSVSGSCLLYRSDDTVRFTHDPSGNIPTLFTRRIYFTPAGSGAVEARSIVTWRTGSLVAEQSVSTVTYLYNIYD